MILYFKVLMSLAFNGGVFPLSMSHISKNSELLIAIDLKLIHSNFLNSSFSNFFPIKAKPCQQNLAFFFE